MKSINKLYKRYNIKINIILIFHLISWNIINNKFIRQMDYFFLKKILKIRSCIISKIYNL